MRCYRSGETMVVVQLHPQQLTEVYLPYIDHCAVIMLTHSVFSPV